MDDVRKTRPSHLSWTPVGLEYDAKGLPRITVGRRRCADEPAGVVGDDRESPAVAPGWAEAVLDDPAPQLEPDDANGVDVNGQAARVGDLAPES